MLAAVSKASTSLSRRSIALSIAAASCVFLLPTFSSVPAEARSGELSAALEHDRSSQPQEKAGDTAWGKEVAGLQGGLSLPAGENGPYHYGDIVPLVLRIRNVSNEPVTFNVLYQYYWERRPDAVSTSRGGPKAAFRSPPQG